MSSSFGQRDHEVGADEHVELGCVQPADALVEHREVQDDEEVVVVLVDLRALVARADVLVVEVVELEVFAQPGFLGGAGAFDVDPANAAVVDLLDARLGVDLGYERLLPTQNHCDGGSDPACFGCVVPWLSPL